MIVRTSVTRTTTSVRGYVHLLLLTIMPFSHRSSLFIVVNTQLFTCGSGKVAQGVKRVLTDVIKEARSYTDEEAAAAFERAIQDRYATDIFE